MRKTGIIFVGIFILVISFFLFFRVSPPNSQLPIPNNRRPTTDNLLPTIDNQKTNDHPPLSTIHYPISQSLFVPSWSLPNHTQVPTEFTIPCPTNNQSLPSNYQLRTNQCSVNNLVFFGISPLSDGSINTSDDSYIKLPTFISLTSNSQLLTTLTVRMLDPAVNEPILKDESKQSMLISESIKIGKENKFNGILLDLEMSSTLPTNILIQEINSFVVYFSKECKKNNLNFSITLYGDTFFRNRPYDVKTIGQYADQIYIMAYDFHKAKGSPGPNFPLTGKEKYGYDFKTMVNEFLQNVLSEKLTFVFGMYGYEWTVDEKKRPIAPAQAYSLNEIRQKYLNSCEWQDCIIKRDDLSAETEINFVQSEIQNNFAYLYYHIVWFEDEQSIQKKVDYLKTKNINSFAYWAYSYF